MKVWELVRIIEESPVKAIAEPQACDIVFRTLAGHTFEVFFDCGEPDYLHWFQPATGDRISFWGEANGSLRAVNAMQYLAGNLLALPHVGDRLKKAAAQAGFTP